jgi:tripartite-type tricarboxylate transporter receptor subunit TctC
MTLTRTFRLLAVAAAALAVSTATSLAQAWPTQRVTIVVPFGAGSVTDILARIFANEMTTRWGQQVIVENKPGLAGTAFVAKAPNDGYTLMVTSNGHTVATLVSKNAGFDPVKDFSGITRLGSPPLFLIAHPGNGLKTVKDVIEKAKAQPGKLNFSSAGLASTTGIAGMLFRKTAGIDIQHVPYKSAPDAVTAVIRGDADIYFVPVNLAKELAEAGKVTPVAAATTQRIPDMPNVPTMTEQGLPFVYDSWFGLLAPAGVPKAILDKIAADWAAALKTPDMQAKFKAQFTIPSSDTPAALDKIIASEVATLTEVFKGANISQ